MAERGLSYAEVGDALGMSAANVMRMLRPVEEGGYATSAHAVALGEFLREPLPLPADDDVDVELMRKLRTLSTTVHQAKVEDIRDTIADLEKLAAKARNKTRR